MKIILQLSLSLVLCGGLLIVIFIATVLVLVRKYKKLTSSTEFIDLCDEINALCDEQLKKLGVPDDAEKIIPLISDGINRFTTETYLIFNENGKVCFADDSRVIAIPNEKFIYAQKIDKITQFTYYFESKQEPAMRGLKTNSNGYYAKCRYSVQFQHDGEEYEILVPPYDIEILQKYVVLNIF